MITNLGGLFLEIVYFRIIFFDLLILFLIIDRCVNIWIRRLRFLFKFVVLDIRNYENNFATKNNLYMVTSAQRLGKLLAGKHGGAVGPIY